MHRDCPDCPCELFDIGIGIGHLDPTSLRDIGVAIGWLSRLPGIGDRLGLAPAVRQALENLIDQLTTAQPHIWIKLRWTECVVSSCWIRWQEWECIEKFSEWIEVGRPVSCSDPPPLAPRSPIRCQRCHRTSQTTDSLHTS